jgi:capsular polysaccharide biosynthesis protein
MSEQSYNPFPEDEISLKDIINFLIESWKIIVLSGLLGIVGSTVYLWGTPNMYQATAHIQLAQISTTNNHHLGVNVEEPNLLILRKKSPTTYASEEIKACSSEDTKSSSEELANSAKFSVVKGVGSLVELKINRDSKEGAIACAQALFDSIKTSQNAVIKPFINEAKDLLVKYQDRLKKVLSLISITNKSGADLSVVYFETRDEVRFLNEEISRLNIFIASADERQAKLISPIYASDIPVAPRKRTVLIPGFFGGLFLGLLLMICKRVIRSYKTS